MHSLINQNFAPKIKSKELIMKYNNIISLCLCITALLFSAALYSQRGYTSVISGTVVNERKEPVEFASVFLKSTNIGTNTDRRGNFSFQAPAGSHIFSVRFIGYETFEENIEIRPGGSQTINVILKGENLSLDEVVVTASGVNRVNQSAYNAISIDTRALQNSTRNLSDAITRAPGVKMRESGGVGSDMQLMLDGFSGRHVKVFIDGIPQEGVGGSFGLNNIPVNFAERIEVYKGVVPVGFGTDAIGGIVNIVTKKNQSGRDQWFLDASYSYGSFNTHKSHINFGRTYKNGLTYEINAFQNYSDNNYHVDTKVKHFLDGGLSKTPNELFRVKRFHDTYHNEALIGSIGVNGKRWADRFRVKFTYSQMHRDEIGRAHV